MFENKHQWDYLKSESAPPLQVPEDLKTPQQERKFEVPESVNKDATSDIKELEKLEIPPALASSQQAPLDISDEADKEVDNTHLNVRTARNTEGYDLLVVEANFDKTWGRVGTAVVEMGFQIEDKSRGEGIYNIYQTINKVMTEEEKFLRPRFDKGLREAYRLHLEDRDTQTRITVQNTAGKIDDSGLARHLLTQLQARLSAQSDAEKKPATNNSNTDDVMLGD